MVQITAEWASVICLVLVSLFGLLAAWFKRELRIMTLEVCDKFRREINGQYVRSSLCEQIRKERDTRLAQFVDQQACHTRHQEMH